MFKALTPNEITKGKSVDEEEVWGPGALGKEIGEKALNQQTKMRIEEEVSRVGKRGDVR